MKKILIATTLVFALSSCFWDKTPETTQTGSTQTGATQTGVTATGATQTATGTTATGTTGQDSTPAAQVGSEAKTTVKTEKVELNSASDQKLVDDFGKDIDDLLIKLTENDWAKK